MYKSVFLGLFVWYVTTSFIVCENVSITIPSSTTKSISQPSDFVHYQKYDVLVKGEKNYYLNLGQHFTALKITSSDSMASPISIETSESAYTIATHPSLSQDKEAVGSFIVFLQPQENIVLATASNTTIKLELFYAPQVNLDLSQYKAIKVGQKKPDVVAQSKWRVGLPEPTLGRNNTQVKHCIIHHSAGSNTDTNYVNALRNVYLLHTQSNGWDDLGYNYVIAPNGILFAGREGLQEGDEDNIQGAHFCAKNGGTMGVCLLGNYNKVSPSIHLLDRLKQLLTWKLHKENLRALDAYPHPNRFGQELSTIAMHRNGCPTACPGDSMALLLTKVKEDVQNGLDTYDELVSVKELEEKTKAIQLIIYPNPSDGRFFVMTEEDTKIERYTLQDADGKVIQDEPLTKNGYVSTGAPNGTYNLTLWSENTKIATRKIRINRRQ